MALQNFLFKDVSLRAEKPEDFCVRRFGDDLEPGVFEGGKGPWHVRKDFNWLVGLVHNRGLEGHVLLDLLVLVLNVNRRHDLS